VATDPQPGDKGAPLGNFKLSVDERLRAYAQGVPGHIRRRRRIEDLEARLVGLLAAAEVPDTLLAEAEAAAELALLNDLIARHNRYYPIEANLPIEVRTGRLLERGVPWRPLAPVTAGELLARAAAQRVPATARTRG
jgi:hypothetical protein